MATLSWRANEFHSLGFQMPDNGKTPLYNVNDIKLSTLLV